jgi:hypothetical protein
VYSFLKRCPAIGIQLTSSWGLHQAELEGVILDGSLRMAKLTSDLVGRSTCCLTLTHHNLMAGDLTCVAKVDIKAK